MKKNSTQTQKKTNPAKKEIEVGPEEFEEQASKDIRMKQQPLDVPEKKKRPGEGKK